MNLTTVDLDILELGNGKNPFEELIAKVEKLSLQGKLDVKKEDIEKTILFLERKFQDFSDSNTDKSKIILQAVNANVMLYEHSNSNSFVQIYNNLKDLRDVALEINNDPYIDISKYLISSNIKTNNSDNNTFSFISLQETFRCIFKTKNTIKEFNKGEEWIFELNFECTIEERHLPLEFIHTLIHGLNTIDGVKVTLEDIKVGSIKARLKAVFDDVSSKEEVKEILESARLFAKGKLEKEYYESEKLSSEATKNNIESEILKESLNDLKSNESKEIKKLQTESLRYDVERKKLENEEKKLELFKKRKNILKELLAEGIIDQKQFEMLINGIPFLKIENGNLTVGENIDIIDDL